jgi:hypothetical protein
MHRRRIQAVREMERLLLKLAEVAQPEPIAEWLDTPNEAFDGLKPSEVIDRGETDWLWAMIFSLESGIAS